MEDITVLKSYAESQKTDKKTDKRIINFWTEDEIYQRFKKITEGRGLIRSFVLNKLLLEWIEEQEKEVK